MRLASVCFFVAMLLATACSVGTNSETEQQQQDSILQAQEDSLLDVFREELEAIDKEIDAVNTSNGLFNLDTTEGEVISRDNIIAKISELDNLLRKKQERVNSVYNKMRDQKLKNERLDEMIKSMQDRLSQRESRIAELMILLERKDLRIEEILAQMDSARMENIDLTQDLMQMDEQLHTIYYVVGEAKTLKEQGIVAKEGGVLGIGASKSLDVSSLNTELFESVDSRDLDEVLVYSKKAKLITDHPDGSFEFVEAGDGTIEKLLILNKEEFWKASDYLVVEVVN